MANKSKQHGINIQSNGSVSIGGDVVGHDKITNETNQLSIILERNLILWRDQLEEVIDHSELSFDEKNDIKQQANLIQEAILTDHVKNPSRIEKLVNTIAVLSPDIFDVVVSTLANPLAGIGLVLRKISNKAKIEKSNPG